MTFQPVTSPHLTFKKHPSHGSVQAYLYTELRRVSLSKFLVTLCHWLAVSLSQRDLEWWPSQPQVQTETQTWSCLAGGRMRVESVATLTTWSPYITSHTPPLSLANISSTPQIGLKTWWCKLTAMYPEALKDIDFNNKKIASYGSAPSAVWRY